MRRTTYHLKSRPGVVTLLVWTLFLWDVILSERVNSPEYYSSHVVEELLATSSSSNITQVYPETIPSNNNVLLSNITFSDPLFSRQWYLHNQGRPGHDINILPVWQQGITGKGVVIALIDDGIDYVHQDLQDSFRADLSFDFNTGNQLPIPDPKLRDHHGTRCAGQLVGRPNNGVCGVGIAPGAQVSALRILSMAISSKNEAAAVIHKFHQNHIYSCSWGPADDGKSIDRPDPAVLKSFIQGLVNGRHGRGSIYVFAAGNGRATDNCNYDGYASGLFALTVGAIDYDHRMPRYMEPCAAQLVVSYSSNDQYRIATTDLGNNRCTLRHGGTSAAAPMVTGILALVLEVRPDLGWRDVRYLCVETAQPVAEDDPSWVREGPSRPYSYKFGFGKVDAYRMVEAAKQWAIVPPQVVRSLPTRNVHLAIKSSRLVQDQIEINERILQATNLLDIQILEYVSVQLDIDHSCRGNLVIHLVAPSGRSIPLATKRPYDTSDAGLHGIIMMTPGFWGHSLKGIWTLQVRNAANTISSGVLKSYRLTFWGARAAGADMKKHIEIRGLAEEESFAQDFFNTYYPPSEDFFADKNGLWNVTTTNNDNASTAKGARRGSLLAIVWQRLFSFSLAMILILLMFKIVWTPKITAETGEISTCGATPTTGTLPC